MNKNPYYLLAGILLLIVIAVVLDLRLNHSTTPSVAPENEVSIPPDHPRQLIEFSLLDQQGHKVNQASCANKFVVVSFLFSSCSVVCPYVTDQMFQIQRHTSDDKDVKLLSLTVDPTADTASVLNDYSRKIGADPKRWSFLTGGEAEMRHLIETSFLPRDTDTNFSSMPGNFLNSQYIALVDTNGRIVKYFDGLNLEAAHAVVQEIHHLRNSP